jgi:hypothetical protein
METSIIDEQKNLAVIQFPENVDPKIGWSGISLSSITKTIDPEILAVGISQTVAPARSRLLHSFAHS